MQSTITLKTLVVTPDKYTRCRMCEPACSYRHFKVISPTRSRIKVTRLHRKPVDTPIYCTQFGLCISACPSAPSQEI